MNVDGDRWTFEPFTRTVTELYVNPAYCRMTGLPVEELLARVARRDMPARLCRLDHLCLFIDSLHAQLRDGEDVQYLPWQVGDERRYLWRSEKGHMRQLRHPRPRYAPPMNIYRYRGSTLDKFGMILSLTAASPAARSGRASRRAGSSGGCARSTTAAAAIGRASPSVGGDGGGRGRRGRGRGRGGAGMAAGDGPADGIAEPNSRPLGLGSRLRGARFRVRQRLIRRCAASPSVRVAGARGPCRGRCGRHRRRHPDRALFSSPPERSVWSRSRSRSRSAAGHPADSAPPPQPPQEGACQDTIAVPSASGSPGEGLCYAESTGPAGSLRGRLRRTCGSRSRCRGPSARRPHQIGGAGCQQAGPREVGGPAQPGLH
jgi:hypothetical protein